MFELHYSVDLSKLNDDDDDVDKTCLVLQVPQTTHYMHDEKGCPCLVQLQTRNAQQRCRQFCGHDEHDLTQHRARARADV